ncbi:MAG: ribbon-helix-helix protein, CopG family [Candidatus Limnocylindria bacterium]
MVYTYTMDELERTQVYLTRAELSALDRIRRETGVTQSELVRRAIDRVYLGRARLSKDERLRIIQAAAGAWSGRTETGAEYVERLRSGRLGRLHARER